MQTTFYIILYQKPLKWLCSKCNTTHIVEMIDNNWFIWWQNNKFQIIFGIIEAYCVDMLLIFMYNSSLFMCCILAWNVGIFNDLGEFVSWILCFIKQISLGTPIKNLLTFHKNANAALASVCLRKMWRYFVPSQQKTTKQYSNEIEEFNYNEV